MKKLWQFKLDFIRKNPILSSYISFMKGVLITIILCSLLSSCKIYTYPPQPEIRTLLAVTSKGDTIQVSTDYLRREFQSNPYTYSNWKFNWENNWYYGYGWYNYYDPYWIYRIRPNYYNPKIKTPVYRQPKTYLPPPPPRQQSPRTPQVQPNRGRSNQQPKSPQYNRPARTQTTPNVIQRPTQTRSNVGRGNNGKVKQ